MTSTKPTPNPRGHRPLEGVGTRMGWLAHALPTRAKSYRGKGVSGRGATQPSPLIPDHAGRKPRQPCDRPTDRPTADNKGGPRDRGHSRSLTHSLTPTDGWTHASTQATYQVPTAKPLPNVRRTNEARNADP